MKRFPKQVYVTIYKDRNDEYLSIHEELLPDLTDSDGKKVALYELKSVKKIEVKVSLK